MVPYTEYWICGILLIKPLRSSLLIYRFKYKNEKNSVYMLSHSTLWEWCYKLKVIELLVRVRECIMLWLYSIPDETKEQGQCSDKDL